MTQAEGELLHEYALKFNDADVTRQNEDVLIWLYYDGLLLRPSDYIWQF